MRLANLAAFRRYAAGLERHRLPLTERLARLDRALEASDHFLSASEFQHCADYVADYGNQEAEDERYG